MESMGEALEHRGPDGGGIFFDEARLVSLTMRRLAILDISGGKQPMESEDGRYALIFNGEIFNAQQLRSEMLNRGIQFHTSHSDTEVLLNLLIHEGVSSLHKLNGMFVFSLYDRAEGTITCARDRSGIKPLYYYRDRDFFAFSSELKSLVELPFIPRTINPQSLLNYASLMFVPGEDSILENVKRLLPAHHLVFDVASRTLEIKRWWRLEFNPDYSLTRDEWRDKIRDTLKSSVQRWAISDVPIGASLSGGLDSSALVSLAVQSGIELKTFSLGYDEPDHPNTLELRVARELSSELGTDHQEIIFEPMALVNNLEHIVRSLDEPYGGGLPSWIVFQAMQGKVKVALTGVGGDELFGNYGKWISSEARFGFLGRMPRLNRMLVGLAPLFQSPETSRITPREFNARFFQENYYLSETAVDEVLSLPRSSLNSTPAFLYSLLRNPVGTPSRDVLAILDFETQLPDEFLLMTDRFSMHHSIEARTPFLDNEMIRLASQIPAGLRTSLSDPKYLLRQTLSGTLPQTVINSPKRGFTAPIASWLRGPLRAMTLDILSPSNLAEGKLFNSGFHSKYLLPHMNGTHDHSLQIWSVLMFELWRLEYRAKT